METQRLIMLTSLLLLNPFTFPITVTSSQTENFSKAENVAEDKTPLVNITKENHTTAELEFRNTESDAHALGVGTTEDVFSSKEQTTDTEQTTDMEQTEQTTTSLEMTQQSTPIKKPSTNNALEVVNISTTSWIVQNKGWDGKTTYTKPYTNAWVDILIPAEQQVLVSFTDLEVQGILFGCNTDYVALYIIDQSTLSRSLAWGACETNRLPPQLYPGAWFRVQFKTGRTVSKRKPLTGFRLLFSMHKPSSPIEQLPDGTWNCSVPHWPDFRRHFRCNLEVECSDGRDEVGCPYSSELCKPGSFRAGDVCFVYVDPRRGITWKEVRRECYERGGRLASLTTPEVWTEVLRILRTEWVHYVFVGLEMTSFTLPDVYHNLFQWSDGTIAYYFRMGTETGAQDETGCGSLVAGYNQLQLQLKQYCEKGRLSFPFLCQLDEEETKENQSAMAQSTVISLPVETWLSKDLLVVECPNHHMTHAFLACDDASSCFQTSSQSTCNAGLRPSPPYYRCDANRQYVPFTLVCDHRADCSDQSDENFCQFPPCESWFNDFYCGGKQCIPASQVCDGKKQCISGNDESECRRWRQIVNISPPPPAIVDFDASLNLIITPVNVSSFTACPETHFQCLPDGYCLPVFLRCNGVFDCPGKTDELGCEDYACLGYYRCRASAVCLHPDHMCDGVFHCPQQDDELLCHLDCPLQCICRGWAFFCSKSFPASHFPDIRYLDATSSGMSISDVRNNSLLIFLSLKKCSLNTLDGLDLVRLRILDVTDNDLTVIKATELQLAPNLNELYLVGNPLVQELFVNDISQHFRLSSLMYLDLSQVSIATLNTSAFSMFSNLKLLNISSCNIHSVTGGFGLMPYLRLLDLRGSDITFFPDNLFSGLDNLDVIYADNFKLCCPDMLPPGFLVYNCYAPKDEISSCGDLLRSNIYRIVLFVLACLAMVGNIGSFIARTWFDPSKLQGFGVLVTHLCVSDFLIGVYLLIIGSADEVYRGEYLWKDLEWKSSAVCKTAGFLSLLSTEVSAFLICLITADRFVILTFPFSRFRFSRKSAHAASAAVWVCGFILAAVPLLPQTSSWNFYGQTGICIPLPITRQEFAGHRYSFAVMIILNFILFLIIALGQIFIYVSIKKNTMSGSTCSKGLSNDLTIASRLITIAVTDFLCWFPIGLLAMLAQYGGVPVSGEVNVALAIVVLPLNSAINPFLYTLNTFLERRRKAKAATSNKLQSLRNSREHQTSGRL